VDLKWRGGGLGGPFPWLPFKLYNVGELGYREIDGLPVVFFPRYKKIVDWGGKKDGLTTSFTDD